MDICAIAVKKHRTERIWTQQHLADVCGVSLRTIQRVERYGTASAETLMSLSSVFEVEHQTLTPKTVSEPEQLTESKPQIRLIILIMLSTVTGSLVGAMLMYWIMR